MNALIYHKIRRYTLCVVVCLGSCTEHFEELNTDPNYPTDVPSINIFTQVIIHSVTGELGDVVHGTSASRVKSLQCLLNILG